MTTAVPPISATMSYEIRPMSIAELLDAGFQLLKNRFLLLGGLSLVGQIPTMLIFGTFGWLMDPFAFEEGLPEIGAMFIVAISLYLLGMLVLMPFVIASITAAVGDLYLGVHVTFESAARKGLARMVPLFITYVIFTIVTLVALGLVGIVLVLGFASAAALLNGAGALGFLIAIGVGVPVFVGLFCVMMLIAFVPGILAAVVVLEGQSLFEAVTRTWSLVGATFWRTTGIAVTVYLLVAIVPAGTQFMVGALPVLGALIWGVVQALCQAYLFAAAVVVYFDMRCRLESFDLEHLAQMVERTEPRAIGP